MHFFHKWQYQQSDSSPVANIRECKDCHTMQGFCMEKGKWLDLGYLEGTNLDGGYWLNRSLAQISRLAKESGKNSVPLESSPHLEAEIRINDLTDSSKTYDVIVSDIHHELGMAFKAELNCLDENHANRLITELSLANVIIK